MNKALKQILGFLFLLIFVTACAPINTPVPTAAPTATYTPVPTATITPVPTQSPDDIADSLGLRSTPGYEDRTFAIEQRDGATYLVDQYNNVPKIVRNEDGSWRKLDYHNSEDAKIMYGAMTPVGGGIYKDGAYGRWGRENESINKQGVHPNHLIMSPTFTGDWEVTKVAYEGQEIRLYWTVNSLLDVSGTLNVVRVAWSSPDVGKDPEAIIWCVGSEATNKYLFPGYVNAYTFISYSPIDALKALRPGSVMGVDLWSAPPIREQLPDPQFYDDATHWQQVLATNLMNDDQAAYSLTAEEYVNVRDTGVWPGRVVDLIFTEGGPAVRGESPEECVVTVDNAIKVSTHEIRMKENE